LPAISLRPYVTAGLALTAAGAITFAPLPTAVTAATPQPVGSSVELTAATNLFTPWVEAFNTASDNATTLSPFVFEAPHAALQQAIVNKIGYLGQLLNDPASIGTVISTIGANLQKVLQATTFAGDPFPFPPTEDSMPLFEAAQQSLDNPHLLMLLAMNGWDVGMAIPDVPAEIVSLINFAASPLSGVLIGAVGPVLSPVVEVVNSIQTILGARDFDQAMQALVAMPAKVVGSVFNGATLNLDFVLPLIAGSMPEGMSFSSLRVELGGLLSPGVVGNERGPGGSLLNSLTLGVDMGSGSPTVLTGNRLGPIAALASLSRIVAGTLGWDGTGNPLTKLTFPKIETQPNLNAANVVSTVEAPAGPSALPSATSTLAAFDVSADTQTGLKRLSLAKTARATAGASADALGTTKPEASETDAGDSATDVGAAATLTPKSKLTPKKLVTALKRESLKATPGKTGLGTTTSGDASNSGTAESDSASSSADSATDNTAAPKAPESKTTPGASRSGRSNAKTTGAKSARGGASASSDGGSDK
jgi:hypothetical protein